MPKQIKSHRLLPWLLALVILALAGWIASGLASRFVLDQTAQRGSTTLRLTVAGLKGALGQYRSLPQLIADKKDIQAFLTSPAQLASASQINRTLKHINTVVQAADTYVMNTKGLTVAASNFDGKTSFIGKNFSFRPYFQQAIAGGEGRFFALGTTSLKRGYYFASPVKVKNSIVGVVAVKVKIDEIESAWRSRDHEIIVTDENGIIFMSSKPGWRFKSIRPLSPETLKSLKQTKRYNQARLGELLVRRFLPGRQNDWEIAVVNDRKASEYLVQSEKMQAHAWTVHIFSDTTSADNQALTITAAVLLVLLSIMLGTAFFFQRRQRLQERIKTQQEARQLLEERVKVRTHDLNQANAKLVEEVGERKAAEEELRKTQADLVQAGKLAALGQMSAALSHELNQPLAAVRSYADNAGAYLDRNNTAQARDNISRISMLVDRMASISRNLRNFARKPNEKVSAVSLSSIIHDAIELLDQRIKTAGAKINLDRPDDQLRVIGGQVRLQQVLVNLINNALDAGEATAKPTITIKAFRENGSIFLTVEDNGPGIDENIAGKIFDPFFTTKGVSEGLGLGLSISYNIIKDFGGELSMRNSARGGAIFSVKLNAAETKHQEAAQ